MSGNIYKVQLVVDVYYRDENNIIDKEEDRNDVLCEMRNTVLNIVEHAEDEGLLQPDCEEIQLMTWHSVVSDPIYEFEDELPVPTSQKKTTDGI
jgi:hypothetical protein